MNDRLLRTLGGLCVIVFLLISASLTIAKGPPSMVSITGPDIDAPVEIDDPDVLEAFSFFLFEDVNTLEEAPADPGEGYIITRYIPQNGADGLKPWDRVIYYPASEDGESVAFLEGLIGEDMATQFDGEWYAVSADGEAAMQQIIEENQSEPTRRVTEPFRFGHFGNCER